MNKEDAILNHCRGKKVVDIGCVEELSDFSPEKMRQTLHYRMRQAIPGLIGVDLEENGIVALNALGCDCYVSFAEDVVKLNLGLFDVIILGDIIEHVPDPCFLLTSLRNILTDKGIVICTTPNAMNYVNSIFLALGKTITRHQHVAWYCRITLENMFRHAGFQEEDFHFLNFHKTTKKFWRIWFEKPLFYFRPELSPHLCGVYSMKPNFSSDEKRRLQLKRLHL
jgi:2-polyprenyl-3-methyl-5-hydroxy-6-metoxy-1,4-benzoquinol methylase